MFICGGGGGVHDIAFTYANFDLSRMTQMRREAEAMGEKHEGIRKKLFDGLEGKDSMHASVVQRLWNTEDVLNAIVPVDGGRFSSKGFDLFYHELGEGLQRRIRAKASDMTSLLMKTKWLAELLNNYVRVVIEALPSAAKTSLPSHKEVCEERNEGLF